MAAEGRRYLAVRQESLVEAQGAGVDRMPELQALRARAAFQAPLALRAALRDRAPELQDRVDRMPELQALQARAAFPAPLALRAAPRDPADRAPELQELPDPAPVLLARAEAVLVQVAEIAPQRRWDRHAAARA